MEARRAFESNEKSKNAADPHTINGTYHRNEQAQEEVSHIPQETVVFSEHDLESLSTYLTVNDPASAATGKVEELESESDGAGTSDADEPFQYSPLKPNSK